LIIVSAFILLLWQVPHAIHITNFTVLSLLQTDSPSAQPGYVT